MSEEDKIDITDTGAETTTKLQIRGGEEGVKQPWGHGGKDDNKTRTWGNQGEGVRSADTKTVTYQMLSILQHGYFVGILFQNRYLIHT